MSSFICSPQATKRSRSRGQSGSGTRCTVTPPNAAAPEPAISEAPPIPRVSTSTVTPWRTSASASLRTCRARPPSITGGYSHDRSSTRLLIPGTLSGLGPHPRALVPRRRSLHGDQAEPIQPEGRGRRPHRLLGQAQDAVLAQPSQRLLDLVSLGVDLRSKLRRGPSPLAVLAQQLKDDRSFEPRSVHGARSPRF